mmetsp:Transcript_27356/g.51873  ORF Transcript_27356/g.51873 Transcript_27356/m.51873 type:complete len:643 (+) Transcript_27356:165-2093(+)|eukprot:CAMPEP_0182514060 /NCGR_PEP_ID=MMETSP1321-20130603/35069_1 /TAXON_ID=91990 /ORGANISM="Bolidomonas sp., Strain RCC1657" /LENGTH=642 /DNA_ID=CAMNT_0024721169 /DNA_START=96 /DNA_END=2024 /DNA_ORIENTATION=+
MGACNSVLSGSSGAVNVTESQKIGYLKNTPFFLYLDEAHLSSFAACFFKARRLRAGQFLLCGQDDIFVVASGEMSLSVTLPSSDTKTGNSKGFLASKVAGDIVNKGDTENQAKRRVSNAKLQTFVEGIETFAKTDTLLLMADMEKFDEFLNHNPSLKTQIEAITHSNISDVMKPIPFLKGIKDTQRQMLAAMCRYEALGAGETCFREGDDGEKLYILLHGSCDVISYRDVDSKEARGFRKTMQTINGELFSDDPSSPRVDVSDEKTGRDTPGGKEKVLLATLKKGDYFGETALMVNIPRTTTVTTKEKSLFVTIGKHEFHNFLRVVPDVNYRMQQVMKDRMMGKLSSMDIPFLQGISKDMFGEFSTNVEMHELDDNDIVFKQGDFGDRFYIIIHGEVRIETDNTPKSPGDPPIITERASPLRRSITMDIGHLGPGKYFGEMSLVDEDHHERTATVIANKHSILMSIGSEVFHKLFDDNPQALVEFRLRIQKENAELKHILSHQIGMEVFETFLKKELADENIMFYKAVNEYKLAKKSPSELKPGERCISPSRRRTSRAIYEEFISQKADTQVNIPGKMRAHIEAMAIGENTPLPEENVPIDVFDKAEEEIYKLMVRDNYARFKKTDEFREFFETLGIFIEVK